MHVYRAARHLVENGTCAVTHLVKLVDAANATITQHQGATFQHHLLGIGILVTYRD